MLLAHGLNATILGVESLFWLGKTGYSVGKACVNVSCFGATVMYRLLVPSEVSMELDGFRTIIQLALLHFKPLGTPLRFEDNKAFIPENKTFKIFSIDSKISQEPLEHWYKGYTRLNLKNVTKPLQQALHGYNPHNKDIQTIFLFASKGAAKLKERYQKDPHHYKLIEGWEKKLLSHLEGIFFLQQFSLSIKEQPNKDAIFSSQQTGDLIPSDELIVAYQKNSEILIEKKNNAPNIFFTKDKITLVASSLRLLDDLEETKVLPPLENALSQQELLDGIDLAIRYEARLFAAQLA